MSVSNMEEAASIAAEYVSSLENLPSEVQFLLAEIRHKDVRCQEIQQEIQKESAKYMRHALRNAGGGAPGAKDAAIPETLAADHAAVAALSAEKLVLARRVVALVQRARARLDHDLARMLVLQGELDPADQAAYAAGEISGRNANAAQSLTESLRQALAPPEPVFAPSPSMVATAPATKRRKVTATPKVASPAPSAYGGTPQRGRRARGSPMRGQKVSALALAAAETMSIGDEDAEGEEDVEEGPDEGEQDESIYCFCQQKSYGEMIACDNASCPYQWFHLECVNLAAPLPDHWYCRECVEKGFAQPPPRKGRKK